MMIIRMKTLNSTLIVAYMTTLNIEEARIKFKLKTKMTPTIRMNFSSDPEFESNLWTCPGFTEDKSVYGKVEGFSDTQSNVMVW